METEENKQDPFDNEEDEENHELQQDKQLLEKLEFTLTFKNNTYNLQQKIKASHLFVGIYGPASTYLQCVFNQKGEEIGNLNFDKKTQRFLASIYQLKQQSSSVYAVIFHQAIKPYIDHTFPEFLYNIFDADMTTILDAKHYVKLYNFQIEEQKNKKDENFVRVIQTTQMKKQQKVNQQSIKQLEDCNSLEKLSAQLLMFLEINRKMGEIIVVITEEYDLFIGDVKKFEVLSQQYQNELSSKDNLDKNYAEIIKKYNKQNANNKFYL